jgi:hypothetical protein
MMGAAVANACQARQPAPGRVWRDRWIRAREAWLDRLTGASRQTLNPPAGAGGLVAQADVAAELVRVMNVFRAEVISPDGRRVDYARLRTGEAYGRYRSTCSPQLRRFDPGALATREERLAFWINLYNALIVDAVIAFEIQRSVTEGRLGLLAFFRRAAYDVSGRRVSCDDIEHGILRANRGHPFLPGMQFASTDPRRAWIVDPPDARIHFALNCAGRSCPPIGVYTAEHLERQLDLATRHFVDVTTRIDAARGELHTSPIFRWYQDDFGGRAGVLAFLRVHLPDDERRAWLAAHQGTVRWRAQPYDWALNGA